VSMCGKISICKLTCIFNQYLICITGLLLVIRQKEWGWRILILLQDLKNDTLMATVWNLLNLEHDITVVYFGLYNHMVLFTTRTAKQCW